MIKINAKLFLVSLLVLSIIPVFAAAQTAQGYSVSDMVRKMLVEGQDDSDLRYGCYDVCKTYSDTSSQGVCSSNCISDLDEAVYGATLAYCKYLSTYLASPATQNDLAKIPGFISSIIPGELQISYSKYVAPLTNFIEFGTAKEQYNITVPESVYGKYTNLRSQGLLQGKSPDIQPTPAYVDEFTKCRTQALRFSKEIEDLQSAAAGHGAQSLPSVSAVLGEHQGDVLVYRPGAEGAPAEANQAIEKGDVIVTGPNGKARIIFDDGSVVELGTNSSFTLEEFTPPKSTFNLDKGAIIGFIKKAFVTREFNFKLSRFAATIRGTEFVLSSDPDKGIDELDLHEGNVDITLNSTGETKSVGAGQSVIVDSSGARFDNLTQEKWDALGKEISIQGTFSWVLIIAGLIVIVGAAGAYYFFRIGKKK